MASKFPSSDYPLAIMTTLKTSSNEVLRSFYENGMDSSSISKSIQISEKIVEFIKTDEYQDAVRVFKDYQPVALTHPFLVSFVSVMICRKLDWNTDRTLKAVALGGLLHNIGMVKMPDHVKYHHPDELSQEDFEIYKTHPEVGMDLLSNYPEIPAAVLQIVYQHHELGGQGYPNGLSDRKIFPLAKIVCLADRYTRSLMEKDLMMIDGLKPFVGLKTEIVQHDSDLVRALIKSFIKEDKTKAKV